MNEFLLNNKGFFAFSDPGAAKGVLALLNSLKKKGDDNFMAISDRNHTFYRQFNVNVEIVTPAEVNALLDLYTPDYVFTGTSYTSSIELECIAFAGRKKIPSYAFIDHWTSLNSRFKSGSRFVYPDTILVIDQRAFDLAVKEGIPEQLLKVFPNPYYDYLKHWKPAISKKDFLKRHEIEKGYEKIISFLPEPLSNVGGIATYGLDEYTCLGVLGEAMRSLKSKKYTVLIKPHPNQDREKLQEKVLSLAEENEVRYVIIEEDINTLMHHSDLVTGIFSNALVEASFFQKPILRILKGLAIADPLASMNIGDALYSERELAEKLNMYF